MTKYYPILLAIEGKSVLVVGGGNVAQRKVESLLEYGAIIYLISKNLTSSLNNLVKEGKIRFLGPDFREDHMEGCFLVVAATDDEEFNRSISKSARERGILINAVDQPEDCSFIVPSVVKRGDLVIAVSTSGKSPALARRIRERLEIEFGRGYELFLYLMGRLRREILNRGIPVQERSRIFYNLVDSGLMDEIAEKRWKEVESILLTALPGEVPVREIVNEIKRS